MEIDTINLNIETGIQRDKIKDELTKFLLNNTAYLSLSDNSKVLVFNSELKIKDAIEALINEEIYCGLIWNTELNQFISLFTLRDYLRILNVTYEKIVKICIAGTLWSDTKHLSTIIFQKNSIQVEELDIIMEATNSFNNSEIEMMIDDNVSNNKNVNIIQSIDMTQFHKKFHTYRDYFDIFNYMSLSDYLHDLESNIELQKPITVDLDDLLIDVITLLKKNHIHRIIVEDKQNSNYTGIITYESIFDYFMSNYYSNMDIFLVNYKEISEMVCRSIEFSYEDETIYSCFFKIWKNKISILPILSTEKETSVLGFVFLKDLIFFFLSGEKYRFDDPIKKLLTEIYYGVNEEIPYGQDRLLFIEESEELSIKSVMEKIYSSPEKKLIIYKGEITSITGIITLSDFFNALLQLNNDNPISSNDMVGDIANLDNKSN